MTASREEALTRGLARRDRDAVEDALGIRVLDPDALWTATCEGLCARDAASLGEIAHHAVRPAQSFDRLVRTARAVPFAISQWHPQGSRALACALGLSEAANRYLVARPAIALPILRGCYVGTGKPLAVMRDELRRRQAATRDAAHLAVLMSRYRVREWVRIVARELSGLVGVVEVVAELSDLAEALIDATTRYHLRRERSERGPRLERMGKTLRPAGFAVIGQGKLGGRELNLSSDIDLQYVYSSDDAPSGAPHSLHQRMSDVARRVTQSLCAKTAHGYGYRVDLELRPEGGKGAVANSIAGAERYYEAWGQWWERLALIRARHVGGQRWVSKAFTTMVRPFVYPRHLDHRAVDEMRCLKERMQQAALGSGLRHGKHRGIDVKRDAGCIREIELFVQMLQFIHGGHDPLLRTPSLAAAIARLHFAGFLGVEDREILLCAYAFLRRLENALQAVQEQQTHLLRPTDDDFAAVARAAWAVRRTADDTERTIAEALIHALGHHRAQVRLVTQSLFGDRVTPATQSLAEKALGERGQAQQQALAALGFAEPEQAQHLLEVLAARMTGPLSSRADSALRALGPLILEDIAKSPDPDQALRLAVDLDTHLRRHAGTYELLLHAATVRRRLYDLLGSSEYLGRAITRHPELIDTVTEARDPALHGPRDRDSMLAELLERARRLDSSELKVRSVRRFKLQEELRLGILDLGGELDIASLMGQQTHVAEACLCCCLAIAREDLGDRLAALDGLREGFVILGLGRFGAQEMGYGSDLDILFVVDEDVARTSPAADGDGDGDGATVMRGAVRLAQRLIQCLTLRFAEGPLYAIDTRLRPSGAQGPLVSTAEGFLTYHRHHAMLWERQALLRARPVAGDLSLGQRLLAHLDPIRYPANLDAAATVEEVRRLRQRMEQEIARESATESNVKSGRGGLVNIEFAVQYLQLRHAARTPQLRVVGTLPAIDALEAHGLWPSDALATLRKAYIFLRTLENRLRMVHNRPLDRFAMSDAALQTLARRTSYGSTAEAGAKLRSDYEQTTEAVRKIYDNILSTAP